MSAPKIVTYLPSGKFFSNTTSIALAAVIILGAHYATSPKSPGVLTVANNAIDEHWQDTLTAVERATTLDTLPTPPDADAYQSLLKEAEGTNLTETIGRTVFAQLTNAKTQGLGGDIPTQEAIVAEAGKYMNKKPSIVYTQAQLNVGPNTPQSTHTYGNEVMRILMSHPKASTKATLIIVGRATDNRDPKPLEGLPVIEAEQREIVRELLALQVPSPLAPLHLLVVNNYQVISETYPDMQMVIEDPLRGLGAVQKFNATVSETLRVFTNLAQQFRKSSIQFNNEEPGHVWSSFVESAS